MTKILIYASNTIGQSMAGPAIRSWEFAKALSKHYEVILISPEQSDKQSTDFQLLTQKDPAIKQHLKTASILIAQTLTFQMAMMAKYYGIKIILDAYDPVPLECLELFRQHPLKQRHEKNQLAILRLNFDFEMADKVLCASEKQRDLWMGLLMRQNRVTPTLYDQDTSLRNLIDVVPFGLSNNPPRKTGPGLREKFQLKPTDKVILWGGGIWNWFDPLSLIQAIKILSTQRQDIKLVFMGVKNPDPQVPDMSMCAETIKLARETGLLDTQVFFNYGWVPYEERQNYLLDADIGVSTHFDHLETRYSFRTRMLDYIWAQLPILATTGDSFADLIESHQLGYVVPYKNALALAQGITHLLDDSQLIKIIKNNLLHMQKQLTWDTVLQPVHSMIHQCIMMPAKYVRYQDIKNFSNFFKHYITTKIREKGLISCFKLALNRISNY